MTCDIWTGPGNRGWWTHPESGGRHWLYSDDQPLRHRERWWLLRVARVGLNALGSWAVLICDPLGNEAYRYIGYLGEPALVGSGVGAPQRKRSWVARALVGKGLVDIGEFEARDQAVMALLERELGGGAS